VSALFESANSDNLSRTTGLPALAYPMAILMKFRPVSTTGTQTLWSFANSAVSNQYLDLFYTGSTVACWRDDAGGASNCTIVAAPTVGSWNSVVVTYTSQSAGSIYLNNEAGAFNDSTDQTLPSANTRMNVGSFAGASGGQFVNSYVAEFVIINRSVTAGEVSDYHYGIGINEIFDANEILYHANYETTLTPQFGTALTNTGVTIDSATHPNRIDYYPLLYSSTPRVFVKPSELETFRNVFLYDQDSPMRGVVFGDSNSSEVGSAGWPQMIRRRYLWHTIRGHTPGTQLVASRAQTGLGGSDSQFWLHHQRIHMPSSGFPIQYNNSMLPPGFEATSLDSSHTIMKYRDEASGGDAGVHILLSHNFDSDCNDEPIEAVNGGNPNFLGGTMQGPGSYINAFMNAGSSLKVEVAALTATGSASNILVEFRPTSTVEPIALTGTDIDSAVICNGLDAAAGSCVVQQTPAISLPSSSNTHCRVRITGNDPTKYALIMGARIVSDDPRGLIIDTASHPGYYSNYYILNHSNSFGVLAAQGYNFGIIRYGALDGTVNPAVHPAVFDENIRAFIERIRTEFSDPDFPFVIEGVPHIDVAQTRDVGTFTEAFLYYPSVGYNIAQEMTNVCFVNQMRICEEDNGWTQAAAVAGTFTADGVHYTTDAGADAVARSSVLIFAMEGLGWRGNAIKRLPRFPTLPSLGKYR
jgi:hypothetical protein